MPKVQYLGPFDRREINRSELGSLAEGQDDERLVWVKEGAGVELSDSEFERLEQLTNKSDWAIQEEASSAIDESSGEPESSSSVSDQPEDDENSPDE